MRQSCLLVLALLAGCAANRNTEDQPAEVLYGGEGLVYETVRPVGPETGAMRADLTLLELDAAFAEQLLGIENASDIAPRSFKKAMGEIAAVNACYCHGRVLARPTLTLKPSEELTWRWSIEHVYLQDWKLEDAPSPVFSTITDGVDAKLIWTPLNIGDSIKVESVSSHPAWPMRGYYTGTSPVSGVTIQIPEVSVVERVATETLRAGETAMFQLSRAAHEDGARIRLLFVRLVAAA